jgi:transposase-like protein
LDPTAGHTKTGEHDPVVHRRRVRSVVPASEFAGFQFPPEVIVLAIRWYLRYGQSYQDVEGSC